VWAAEEYDALALFDGETGEQAMKGAFAVFMCHQGRDDELCAGWVGCHDMPENLALRVVASSIPVDWDAVFGYQSPVPLFGSGAEAAQHGKRDIGDPSWEAMDAVEKIMTVRELRGKPVRFPDEENDE
jgi:hypothetical protein